MRIRFAKFILVLVALTLQLACGQTGSGSGYPSQAFVVPVMRNVTVAGGETFGLMFTGDDFATVTDCVSGDLAAAPGEGLRDPALFRAGSKWYCACTLNAWGGYPNQNKFRILVSDNLVNWTTLKDVTVNGATQFTWAPKWFYDAPTNRVYITLSSDRTPGVGAHEPKLAYASLADLTTWSTWATVSSLPSVFWDFQLSSDGAYYYAAGVTSGGSGSIKIYRSTSIDSGYTLFSDFDFGAGLFAEQCFLDWLGGTKWAIYYSKPTVFKSYRRISTDGMATWSPETVVNAYAASGKSFACPFRLSPEMLAWFTPAENWRLQFFGILPNVGDAADIADPNRNGINNLMEYALGGEPKGGTTGMTILPRTMGSAGNRLQFTFTRYADRIDLTLTVKAADSLLGPWTPLAQSTAGGPFVVLAPGANAEETGTGNARSVAITDPYAMNDPAHPRRFMKLEVVR